MFEELDAPLPDRERYLERIGFSGPCAPDLGTLDKLACAHQQSVPFENLDVYDLEAEIKLDTASLYDKVVVRRRGGYCFELNALFMALLRDVGYECYPVAARVVWMATGYMPKSHRATVVEIGGTRYFCDVGFGGPSPRGALRLDETGPQRSGRDVFQFGRDPDGDFVLFRLKDSAREQLLKFSDRPCRNVDFLALNEYQSRNKNSGFRRARLVNIARPGGSASITGSVLRVHTGKSVEETQLDTEVKLKRALEKEFGIVVDFPLKV